MGIMLNAEIMKLSFTPILLSSCGELEVSLHIRSLKISLCILSVLVIPVTAIPQKNVLSRMATMLKRLHNVSCKTSLLLSRSLFLSHSHTHILHSSNIFTYRKCSTNLLEKKTFIRRFKYPIPWVKIGVIVDEAAEIKSYKVQKTRRKESEHILINLRDRMGMPQFTVLFFYSWGFHVIEGSDF